MVFEELRSLLAMQFDYDEEKITKKTSLMEDFGADSLDLIELQMAVEEAFGVVIEEDKAKKMKTVGDVVKYLESVI